MRIAEAQLVRAAGELAKEGSLKGSEIARSVIELLRRKRMSRRLGKVERSLSLYVEQESRTLSVLVTSARVLEAAERSEIEKQATAFLGKSDWKAALEFREDSSLIGGIRIETADTCYDQSVSRALRELHKSL
ncbi:MAG: F0F1 ATP synthase subunit delta [Candidatus Moraniibacteriota bacterium]